MRLSLFFFSSSPTQSFFLLASPFNCATSFSSSSVTLAPPSPRRRHFLARVDGAPTHEPCQSPATTSLPLLPHPLPLSAKHSSSSRLPRLGSSTTTDASAAAAAALEKHSPLLLSRLDRELLSLASLLHRPSRRASAAACVQPHQLHHHHHTHPPAPLHFPCVIFPITQSALIYRPSTTKRVPLYYRARPA